MEISEGTPLQMPLSEARDIEAQSRKMQASRKRKSPTSFQEPRPHHTEELEDSESEAEDIHLFRRVHAY